MSLRSATARGLTPTGPLLHTVFNSISVVIARNRVLCQRREKQEVVDQQIAEIDKLNSVISLVEKEMVRVKKMYAKERLRPLIL